MTCLQLLVYHRTLLTMYHHPCLIISFQSLCRHRSVPHHLDCAAATFWMKGRGQESVWQTKQKEWSRDHVSSCSLQAGNIGDNVALPVPMVDRGREDSHNILGVIIDKNENDLYTTATRHGILSNKYTRADFTLCPQQLLKDSDIKTDINMFHFVKPWNVQHLAVKDLSNVIVRPCRKT